MQSSDLDGLLLSSVESALASVFGTSTMKAVDFYVDKRIVLSNPAEYSRSMRKLFGQPAEVLLSKITEGISKGVGLSPSEFSSLEDCVVKARAKLGGKPS